MAAKFDKEMMKKHHFWLLLIPLMIGLLLAWIGLFAGVADATVDKQKKNVSDREAVQKVKAQPKKTLESYEARKGELFDLRTKRWKEMWDAQQALYTWPKALGDDQIAKMKDKKFGDDIADSAFINTFRDHYLKDYDALAKDVAPLQFAGGWRGVLRHVPNWIRAPEPEDVWLAMEDFWVQREIVSAIASINTESAKLNRIPPAPGASDDPFKRAFANRTWRLDLQIVDGKKGTGSKKIVGKIRNLTQRLQPYGANNQLLFKIWLSNDPNARPFVFAVQGTSLPGESEEVIKEVEAKHTILDTVPTELFKVEQIFDPRTVPVKRLEQLKLGYLSAKHSNLELQMTSFSQKAVDAASMGMMGMTGMGMAGDAFGAMGMFGGPMGPGSTGVGSMMGGFAGGGFAGAMGGAAATDLTYNQLVRRRYLNRTEQVRAMPIGLSVIVDQGYTQDVLTVLANSQLRIQLVQMHLNRFRGNLSYDSQSSSGGLPGGMMGFPMPPGGMMGFPMPPGGMAGFPAFPPGGMMGFPMPPGGIRGFPPGGMMGFPGVPPGTDSGPGSDGGAFGAPRSSSEDLASGNLVELGVYGIASLYEKFEEKKDMNTGMGTGPAGMGMNPMMPPSLPMGMMPPVPPMGMMGMGTPTGMGMMGVPPPTPPTMPTPPPMMPPPMPMMPPKQ